MAAYILTAGAAVVELQEDMQWVDEYEPWKVAQTIEKSLSGALIIHESAQLAGRPITLASGPDSGWVQRSVLETLRTLEATANAANMTLQVPAYPSGYRNFTVRFRRDTPAISAAPVKAKLPPAPTDYYTLTLRLLEVA